MGRTKGEKMKQKRLPWGQTRNMSEEEYRQYKRALQKRWRHNHPDRVRAENRYYSKLYSQTKPFQCVCVKCGKTFGASRNTVKTCPKCREVMRHLVDMRRKAIVLKREEKQAEYQQIARMYRQGVKQQVIAGILGRSQSGISVILRRLNKRR